ncbi:uncharacterized protein PG986_001562 [Apiospora aurea]|uniref:Uncharacterized protein n=1 Tax=Apiospora aurea TaxID=335848 RepID=A0ABR1QX51_9PEZI
MSAKKEVLERERERERPVQPREIQPSRPQDIKTSREQEDTELYNRYANRHNEYNDKLAELITRRSYIENELISVDAAIKYHQQEQARVAQEYKDKQEAIAAQRRLEDQRAAAHDQMELERSRESGKMSSQGRTRRASIRDITHQQNGSGGGWTSINARPRSRREDDDEHHADPGNLLGKGYQPMDDAEPNGRSTQRTGLPRHGPNGHGMEADDSEASLAYRPRKADEQRPLKPKQRHSLPSFSAGSRGSPKQETPIESKPRSPSGRRSLPSGRSQATSAEAAVPPDMTEINKDTLILKHDGQKYVEPPMYEGVPLERIDKNHPYWDPEWEPLEDIIVPQLEKWQEKLDTLRRTPEAVRHTVFLANRQVNRGQAVVDFLKGGDFHPYQYVGKEMMKKFYKTFINYDTMFRLVNVHEELKKFDLDVTPLEWLRQRMFEVSRDQGDKFSLSKYTHDLYHDYKLKALREKHGFGNIGRPSGYKVGEKNPDKIKNGKIKRESSVGDLRRKGRRISQVDMGGDPSMMEHYHAMHPHQHPHQRQEYLEPVTPRQSKRLRLEADAVAGLPGGVHPHAHAQAQAQAHAQAQAQALAFAHAQQAQQAHPAQEHAAAPIPVKAEPEPEVDDLEYDGYTSRDSFSAGRIMHLDFRIYQIKTSELTTSTEITQYWTWSQEKSMFEHQVLRDVHPKVTWGYYQQHITFDLKLDEIVEAFYAKDCLKVIVVTKTDRGRILVHFKRDRTLKRFLSFSRRKGVQLVKSSGDRMEDAWNKMESKVMADDSDS